MIRQKKKVLGANASAKLLIRASAPEGTTKMGNVDSEFGGRRERREVLLQLTRAHSDKY